MHVTVLGAGTIGSTVAYDLATNGLTVCIADIEEGKSQGHTIDTAHSIAHATHSIGREFSCGEIESVSPGREAVISADCIVVTASAPRPSGANQRGGRAKWLEDNLEIAEEIAGWFREATPCPVIVVTNPVDFMTYELYRQSTWPSGCFLGYSLSETARLGYMLAREYEVKYKDVYCPVLGEHGENIVPVFSRATIQGDRITLDDTQRQTLLDYVRDVPYRVMNLRGAEESSRWVTGRGVSLIVQRLLDGGITDPIGLSTPLDGEYGYENVSLSVPVTLDETGVREIVEWNLSDWEQRRMGDAYRAVTSNLLK